MLIDEVKRDFDYKSGTLLITGGTGTFGKELINYLLANDLFGKIIVLSRDEYKQYWLSKTLKDKFDDKQFSKMRFFIGDIRDYDRLLVAFKNVDFIIHAAAMKQVPACEVNPEECIKTNINGSINVVNAAIVCNVRKVVFLSTDKAVEPINIYGASKMTAEKYTIFGNVYAHASDRQEKTSFCCIRYGNVSGSRGSVIELFLRQANTNIFTLTSKEMTRFFIRPEEACELALFALINSEGGEVFIPRIKACKISDLLQAIDPEKEIEVIGIRAGEKVHEILINQSERKRLSLRDKYYVILPERNTWNKNAQANNVLIDCENEFASNTCEQFTWKEIIELVSCERERLENE